MSMADGGIKTKVNLKDFEKAAADRVPLGVIAKEQGATITRMGMDGKIQTMEANAGDKLYKGDIVKTPADGSAVITLADKSQLTAGANSKVDISQYEGISDEATPRGRGTLSAISGKLTQPSEGAVQFHVPTPILGVRG